MIKQFMVQTSLSLSFSISSIPKWSSGQCNRWTIDLGQRFRRWVSSSTEIWSSLYAVDGQCRTEYEWLAILHHGCSSTVVRSETHHLWTCGQRNGCHWEDLSMRLKSFLFFSRALSMWHENRRATFCICFSLAVGIKKRTDETMCVCACGVLSF